MLPFPSPVLLSLTHGEGSCLTDGAVEVLRVLGDGGMLAMPC